MIIPAAAGTTAVLISQVDGETYVVEVPVIGWDLAGVIDEDNCRQVSDAVMILPETPADNEVCLLRLPDGQLMDIGNRTYRSIEDATAHAFSERIIEGGRLKAPAGRR